MIKHSLINVSNVTPTLIDISESIRSSFTLIIQNISATGYIYLGSQSVTSLNYGFRVSPNQAFTIELPSSQRMYAIASDAGMQAAIMEIDRAI
jgi:hypothetical protein